MKFSIFNFQFKKFIDRSPARRGFTLIELLVVISIIGILIGLSAVAFQSAKASSRDTKRRADLEDIRSALEIYRTDCAGYPATVNTKIQACGASGSSECTWGSGKIVGDGSPSSCATANTYMSQVPKDPHPSYTYQYYTSTTGYTICARLENGPSTGIDCNGNGSADENCGPSLLCNYRVASP